jgi:single-strand DNA-binding protein
MAADNHTTIVGNLVEDPELRFTSSGIAVANLRVRSPSASSRTANGATETPEGEKRSVAEIEADEVGASLRFATAKVERASERATSDRSQGRERQAERGGDFNDQPPF